ncbi:MAG: hypothetical protein ACLUR5_11380 [Eubacterium ventriosum]
MAILQRQFHTTGICKMKKADKVVIELVERHIHALIEEAPYIWHTIKSR